MPHPNPTRVPEAVEDLFRRTDAEKIRTLFCVDQETRRMCGGPPYTKDIVRELENSALAQESRLPKRKRQTLGTRLIDNNGGRLVGYASCTIVSGATPTNYERTNVWGGHAPEYVHGVFLRRLVVHPDARRKGVASAILKEILRLADAKHMHCYAHIMVDNAPMRSCAAKAGGAPNVFWHTPKGRLMVRYIW